MNDYSNALDITKHSSVLSKDALKVQIIADVRATQSGMLIVPLPDILLLRQDQYDLLIKDVDVSVMPSSEDLLYRTPDNAMHIKLKRIL